MNRIIGAINIPFNNKETKLARVKQQFTPEQYNDYLIQKSNTTSKLQLIKWKKCTKIPKNKPFIIDDETLRDVIETYNPNNKKHRNMMDGLREAYKNDNIAAFFFKSSLINIIKNPEISIPEYRRADMYLLPKKDDGTNPDNFRPIISLDLISKIISKNICKRINEDCETWGLINKNIQAAFNGKMERNCHFIYSIFKRRKDLQQDDWVCFFFDLTNAYGTVNYGLLNEILMLKGFSKEICDYVKYYYTNCTYTYKGKTFAWQNGLYQGDPLSRILFIIYLDYVLGVIFQKIKKKKLVYGMEIDKMTKAFVDDIAMFIPRKNLDKILKIIFSTCAKFGLTMNANKTFFISINPNETQIQIGEQIFRKADAGFLYVGLPSLCGAMFYFDKISKEIYDSLKIIDEAELTGEQKMYVWYRKIFMAFKRKIDLVFYSNQEEPYYMRVNEIFGMFVEYGIKWGAQITMEKLWKFAILNRGKNIQELVAKKYHKYLFFNVCQNAENIWESDEDWKDNIYSKLTGFEVPEECDVIYENLVAQTHNIKVSETQHIMENMDKYKKGYVQNTNQIVYNFL